MWGGGSADAVVETVDEGMHGYGEAAQRPGQLGHGAPEQTRDVL